MTAKKFVVQWWFEGAYEDLEFDFKNIEEARAWVNNHIKELDDFEKNNYDAYGWRIMEVKESGRCKL